jgi:teichuronic acid biosynthesis glycosyltransferase TuaG
MLHRPLDSIKLQIYKNYEIIIVDDCSDDGTEMYLNDRSDNNLKYYRLNSRSGPNIARNVGSTMARGAWLIFLDSDDSLYDETSLMKLDSKINTIHVPLIFALCVDQYGISTVNNTKISGYITFHDYISGAAKGEYLPIVKKDSFHNYRFYTDIRGGEGLTWMTMIKEHGVFILDEVLRIYYTDGNDRLSIKSKNLLRLFQVTKKELKLFWGIYLIRSPTSLVLKIAKMLYYGIFGICKL